MTTSSASQRALSNHLILTNIFSALEKSEDESIYYDNDIHGIELPPTDHYRCGRSALLRCSLVNHLWWRLLSIPFLWRDVTPENYQEWSISDNLYRISDEPLNGTGTGPSRRQFHANLIEIGTEYSKAEISTFTGYPRDDKRDDIRRQLKFPKLSRLVARFPGAWRMLASSSGERAYRPIPMSLNRSDDGRRQQE